MRSPKPLRFLVSALIVLVAAGTSPAAHAVDPGLFAGLHWRLLGPFRGGRVLAVSGVPGEPEHFYFGSVNGGVWETRDGGHTWSHVGLADSQQIGRILIDPGDPEVVYVAALGHPYGPNDERGVFRSRDGGRRWQKVLGPDADTGAIDLAFEPGNPRVIYAALWQTRRTPWSIYPPSNGPGSGLHKSTDGGDTWARIEGGGFPNHPGRIGVAVAPTEPQRVYAIVDSADGGLYRSDDGGAHWRHTSDDPRIWGRGWYFGALTVEPKDADVV